MRTRSQTQAKATSNTSFTSGKSGLLQRKCACGNGAGLDGMCEDCRETRLQRRGANGNAPSIVYEVLRSPGHPLDPQIRVFMEQRFGRDFSKVRIHTDARAAESAQAVNALAYAMGDEIVFNKGQYSPTTMAGQRLVAHELTHVVQQQGGSAKVAHRQAEGFSTSPSLSSHDESAATERLLAIIMDIERVKANASRSSSGTRAQEGGTPESNEQTEKISAFLEQLRAVANGNDEELKLRVLAGFSSQGIQQAEAKLAEADTTVREQRPQSLVAKTLGVSHPGDAVEIEADRVAQAVVQGSGVTVVTQAIPGGVVNRQAEALAGAGAAILALEAESLPATSWNPPGWVILGVATVVAAALIGTAVYMASNVADTGIMEEVQQLIEAAKAAGSALTICEALAQLMAAAKRAGDSKRVNRIKATEKAKGCRHSSYS